MSIREAFMVVGHKIVYIVIVQISQGSQNISGQHGGFERNRAFGVSLEIGLYKCIVDCSM